MGQKGEVAQIEALRHGLAFYALFAGAAAVANRYAAAVRSKQRLDAYFPDYTNSQRVDRRAALASSAVSLVLYALTFSWALVPTIVGVTLVVVASGLGLKSQATSSASLVDFMRQA